MVRDEFGVDHTPASQHVEQSKGQCGIAAGEGLKVEVGHLCRPVTYRVDDDFLTRCFSQPVTVSMRRRVVGIGAPDHDAVGILGGTGIESQEWVAEGVLERHLACQIANAVRFDLSCAETIEEAVDRCKGNIPKAAALLDVSASTIYRKRQLWKDEGKLS